MNINEYFKFITNACEECIDCKVNAVEYINQLIQKDKRKVLKLVSLKQRTDFLDEEFMGVNLNESKIFKGFDSIQRLALAAIISDINDVVAPLSKHIPVFSSNERGCSIFCVTDSELTRFAC